MKQPPFFTNPYHILIVSFILLLFSFLLKIYVVIKKIKNKEKKQFLKKLVLITNVVSLILLAIHFLFNNYYVNYNINSYNQNVLKFFQTIMILLPSVYYLNRKYVNSTKVIV